MFYKTTLKNGLRIITVPQKNSQAVTVLVLVGTGSKYETKEISGISHFLEHMFFKGTRKRPTTVAIAETLDRVGGIFNAFTSEEYTGYFAKVDSSHLDLALDWVADIFLNSKLDEKEIAKEKGVISEEINMRYDHPMTYVQTLWTKLLYGDQPAGWDVAGTKESVAGISRDRLMDYMKKQYVASNTVVCVAGNFANYDVEKEVKKYFSKISKDKAYSKPGVEERQTKPEILLEERKTDQAHLCLGVRAYNLFHSDRYVQEVLGTVLGGMMSSRLFIKVRERLGLAYYIHTSAEADTDTGFLMTQAGVDNNKVELSISTILKEYKRFSQIKVPQKELQKAKDYTKGKMALLLESSDAQASFYGTQELLEKKILTPEEINDRINKVKQSDILRVAKDIFQPQKLNLALIGPFTDKKPFEKILHEF
jgi:predicted Zn-dependent peptidase